MRNASRPNGRFLSFVMLAVAAYLAVGVMRAQSNGPSTTQVADNVYRADGTPAKGTILISWPAFTTANGTAVAAGSLNVSLGNGGAFSASLAPNTGAQPAGVYYRVVYQLTGQEPSTEYWVVPATGSTTIGAVRAKLQPPTIAAQVLTRDVADSNYVHVSGNSTVNGVVTFNSSPAVPTPQNPGDVANKAYVDAAASGANLASPPAIGSTAPNAGSFTGLTAQTFLNDSTATQPLNFIAQSVFKTPVAINRTLTTNNSTLGWVDSALTIQQAIVPPGNSWTLCPNGGQIAGGHQFNIPFQVGAFNCDGNATAANTEPMAVISGNLTLTPTASRQPMSVAEFNSLSHVSYQLAWDSTGTVPGSEFYNWGGLFTNIADGKGGVGVYVKSNFWNGGNPGYAPWQAGEALQVGGTIKPTISNGFYYQVTTPSALPTVGNTGGTEPKWCTSDGCTVHDGTIVWTGHPQSGEGAWQVAYRAQDWLGAGLDIVNTIPNSTGYGVMLRSPNNTSSLNLAFARGNPAVAGNVKWVTGMNAAPYTDWFSFYSASDNLNRVTMKPGAETRVSSAGVQPIVLNMDVNSGTGGVQFGSGGNSPSIVASVDAAGNATVNNLTVNGACTGCGGSNVNLAAPPAIGNTTPNSAAFTQVNNIIMADAQAGADACAKISNAVNAAAATGQAIDARGFTGNQACAATLTIGKPVTIWFGDATFTLGGNPGINITTAHAVTLKGHGWDYLDPAPSSHGTIFKSGGAYPLLADNGAAQGSIISDIEFDGNSMGTFGIFMPQTGNSKFSRLYVHNFSYAGIIAGGILNHFEGLFVTANGGDGVVAAADCVMDGNTEVVGNGATGVQVVSGGCRISRPNIADNGLHNLWLNGTALAATRANSTQIVQPILLRPTAGNTGNYIFYAANPGGTTGASAPASWCQTQGCVVSDGTVKWVNLNTLGGVSLPLSSATLLSDLYVGDAGNATISTYPSFQASNVRIDGWAGQPTCDSVHINGLHIQQGYFLQANTDGLHIANCQNVSVTNAHIGGESYNPAIATPDRGGLVLEGVATSVFSDLTFEYQARSAVQVKNASSFNQFTNVHINSDVGNAVTAPNTYGVYVDTSSSAANTFTNLYVSGRATNSRGVSMPTGVGNFVHNYIASGTNSGTLAFDSFGSAVVTNVVGRDLQYPVEFDIGNNTRALMIDNSGNTTVQSLTVTGTCTGCASSAPGQIYYVSKYASIQAAIDAAYNSGTVQGPGTVVDDRTSPYTGPGFTVKDSVTLRLAATTYTINGTVSYNNGNNTVTAGIIALPGSHIVGAGTSPNHGTNVNAGAGLNADVIATSTVGTGTGANAQWWHWGSIENFHMDGNKASQTAGNCINVENMGETAALKSLELGNCYASDLKLEGNFATQSEITNVTVNSAGQYGVNLDNFQGVGVLRGLSGDSNATSIIRFNGMQSATLTVLGLKSEEEVSGHDPLITIDMPTDGSQPGLYVIGGYTYGRAGVHDVIKIINGKSGAAPFVTVTNFYVDSNFANAVNDTVNSRTYAAANMNKVPFSYLPTGSYQSGQAFTFAPGTFIQGGSSILTEIFGSNTDGSSMIAAQGNGDGTNYFTGGLKFGIPNRAQFGSSPEMMARMGSRFLGSGQGYDTNTWVFVPIWKTGDTSKRWIGEPNQRWPEVYATDVNTTTATIGTLNVTSCVGCGGTPAWGSITGTLSSQTDLQTALNGKAASNATTTVNGVACALGGNCTVNATSSAGYWTNQVGAGSSITMSPSAANKIACYGVALPYTVPLKTVVLTSATASDSNLYGVAVFAQSATAVSASFTSTAVNWPASGANASFQQSGGTTASIGPGLYAVCTTGNNATTTGMVKGSGNSTWYYAANPSGLSSTNGVISGSLATGNGSPTMGNSIPNIQLSGN